MAERLLDVVAEYPEKRHVADDVKPARVQEGIGDEREFPRHEVGQNPGVVADIGGREGERENDRDLGVRARGVERKRIGAAGIWRGAIGYGEANTLPGGVWNQSRALCIRERSAIPAQCPARRRARGRRAWAREPAAVVGDHEHVLELSEIHSRHQEGRLHDGVGIVLEVHDLADEQSLGRGLVERTGLRRGGLLLGALGLDVAPGLFLFGGGLLRGRGLFVPCGGHFRRLVPLGGSFRAVR